MSRLGPAATAALSLLLVLAGWMLVLRLFDVDPLVGKTPLEVAHYLLTVRAAASHRAVLLAALLTTLGHAAIGFAAGLALGVGGATLLVLSPACARVVMPVAMILRSVPLVAMTPLIVLVCGRGLCAIGVIGAIVVFFPTLANLGVGLRATPSLSADLVRVYGGTRWTVLRKVALPTALPALFASIRIGIPAALLGALLSEWLASGNGLGDRMQRDVSTFRAADLWSAVVLLTLASLLLYAIAGTLERRLLAPRGRLGQTGSRDGSIVTP